MTNIMPSTTTHNQFDKLRCDEPSEDNEPPETTEVPISEFIRYSKRRLKKTRYLINKNMKQHEGCASGCQCEAVSGHEGSAADDATGSKHEGFAVRSQKEAVSGHEGSAAKATDTLSGHEGSAVEDKGGKNRWSRQRI